MGRHWAATSLLSRPDVLHPRVLLFDWRIASSYPVDIAQEIQICIPEISHFPTCFRRPGSHATRNTDQLRAFGLYLLLIQLRHPSPSLRLVVQVQLCVYHPLIHIPGRFLTS